MNLKHLTTKLDADTFEQLTDLAETEFNGQRSVAARRLIEEALDHRAGRRRDPKREGYQDGLRQGLHEAREAIRAALAALW